MPVFEFPVSGGGTVQIEANSLQEAQDQLVRIPGVQGMRSSSPMERFGSGFQQSWGDTAYGIKQLAGAELTPEQQTLVDQPMPEDLSGQLGYMAGEISQLAAPGGAAGQAAARLGRWGPAAADIVLNAIHGFAKGVSEDESRMMNMAENVAGTAAGRGIVRAVSGVNPTDEAVRMMQRGTRLTPGQAAGTGSVPGLIEEGLTALPVGGSVIRSMRRRAIRDWNRDMLARVSPDGSPPLQTGREGIAEISDRFRTYYRRLLPDDMDLPADDVFTEELTDSLGRYSSVLDDQQFRRFQGRVEQLWDMAAEGRITGANVKSRLKQLRKDRDLAYARDYQEGSAYDEVVNSLREMTYRALGPEGEQALRALDYQYSGFLPVEEAMSRKGALTSGLFTPDQLISTAKGRGQQAAKRAARGRNPMLEQAAEAEEVLGNAIPSVGPGTAEKLLMGGGLIEPSILGAGITTGVGYPMIRPFLTNPLGRGAIPGILGDYQFSSQAGQILTDR